MFAPITSLETREWDRQAQVGTDEKDGLRTNVAPYLHLDLGIVVPLDDVDTVRNIENKKPCDEGKRWDVACPPVSGERNKDEGSGEEGGERSRSSRHIGRRKREGAARMGLTQTLTYFYAAITKRELRQNGRTKGLRSCCEQSTLGSLFVPARES